MPTQTQCEAMPPAGRGVLMPYGHGRTRRSGSRSVRAVRVGSVDARFLAPPSGCRRCGGGWTGGGRFARPPATLWHPAGVGCGAGGGAAGVLRAKGPAVLPARPSGPGRTDNDMCRPNGPTVPLDARAVRGTVGPLGRTGWGWQPPGPATLAGRTAGPLGRTTEKLDVNGATYIIPPPART